jgi:chromosomal replication initiator protein
LLVIDDVHFLAGKKATQEEFLHTFNSIEAMGRQVVMASDNHPKMIEEFGESLVNRFVSGMVSGSIPRIMQPAARFCGPFRCGRAWRSMKR